MWENGHERDGSIDAARPSHRRAFVTNPDTDLARGELATPIGTLLIATSGDGVVSIQFEGQWTPSDVPSSPGDSAAASMLERTRRELREYFAGRRRTFTVPCVARGTPFQHRVWSALRSVPFGEVASYRTIAERLGNPRGVRAVGAANGANPIPIIVPCHRVIGSDGLLTGFGGGLPRKQWLLEHEGALTPTLDGGHDCRQ